MNSLFPEEIFPPGFQYFPEFITKEEESLLIEAAKQTDLHIFNFQGYQAKRKTASFGFDYSFDKRKLQKGKNIPHSYLFLIEKVAQKLSISTKLFAELLVTEYPIDSVINWHRDAPPFDIIAGISLNTDCTFRLRPQEKEKQGRKSIISFPVRRRSLYVIAHESRSEWQHSIAPVKKLRYSITLRTLKEKQ